jgi:hypothetical protein
LTGVIVARIFISYATPDRAIADEVATWLRAKDHYLFLDHDRRNGIGAGEDWKQRLYNELRKVDVVVGVVTSSFLVSPWCSAELGIADALGCLIIPLRAATDAAHPLVQNRQYVDYHADPQQARDRVLQAVRRLDDGRGSWRAIIPSLDWSRSPQRAAGCFSVERRRPARSAIGCAPWAVPAGCWPSSGPRAVGSRRW